MSKCITIYVRTKIRTAESKKSGSTEKYPGRVIRWLAPLKLIDYYERHLTFKEA